MDGVSGNFPDSNGKSRFFERGTYNQFLKNCRKIGGMCPPPLNEKSFFLQVVPVIDRALDDVMASHRHPTEASKLSCVLCNAKNYQYENRSNRPNFTPEARFEPDIVKHPESAIPVELAPNSWLSESK